MGTGISLKDVIEVRFHGRGGQGAWTASQLLAYGGLRENRFVQSFPAFGPEREGAPIQAFTRISNKPITLHSMVYEPDIVVVLDETLLGTDVIQGINPETLIVVNTNMRPEQVREKLSIKNNRVWVVAATDLATKMLGRPIVNTAMLGAVVRASGIIEIGSLVEAIRERFSGQLAERNISLVHEAQKEAKTD